MKGISSGFRIVKQDAIWKESHLPNHRSALHPQVRPFIDEIITREIEAGNYIVSSRKPAVISPLGAVPKSDGGYRLIHDCSVPAETGVNSQAPEFDKYTYESVDNAVAMIKPGDFLAKVDIKSAYRHIPIHPSSQRVTGLNWKFSDGRKLFLYDAKLPFGAKASPTIFHRISQAVKRMMQRRGYDLIVAYQDDFLIIGRSYEQCREAWIALINLLLRLGFEINYGKLVAPTTCLVFLGVQLDTVACELSLPAEKLCKIRDNVSSMLQCTRATKRQLQRLAGSMNFAAKVVRGGRIFMRRILNCISRLKRPEHKARLDVDIRGDILWWHRCMESFNGVSAFIDGDPITPILTDACTVSGGAFCDGDFRYVRWDVDFPEIADAHINVKETMIAVQAVITWAHLFRNRTVYICSDNTCAVSIINKASSKCDFLMCAIRQMFWLSSHYNFVIRALYMPGKKHIMADTLSRLHEPGKFLYWEHLVNEWFLCHYKIEHMMVEVNLCNHMSLSALCTLLRQVLEWRRLRGFWTERSGD